MFDCVVEFAGLLGWWDGDANDGNSYPSLVGSDHATGNGNIARASGNVGSAYSLSGEGDFLTINHSENLNVTTGITALAWVNGSRDAKAGAFQAILSKWQLVDSFDAFQGYDAASTSGLNTKGYSRGVFDGRYVYFVPRSNSSAHGNVLRYDSQKAFTDSGSWVAYNAESTSGLITKGYFGAAFDGRYVYFAPLNDGQFHGKVLRYDTQGEFTSSASWLAYDASSTSGLTTVGYGGAVFDGRYVYFIPFQDGGTTFHGKVLRYDAQAEFSNSSSWSAYNAESTSALTTKGYSGAVFDGRYLYFTPFQDTSTTSHGNVLRFDTQGDFVNSSNWTAYDAGLTDGLPTKGYNGGVSDGRYIYFAPAVASGGTSHGTVLRYDTQGGFATSSNWKAYDASSTSGLGTRGYGGAVFDGRYVYFVPFQDTGTFHARVLRYDTQGDFSTSTSWIAADATGTGGLFKGYTGAVFDGRFIYFVPRQDSSSTAHGRVLRYDTTGDKAAFALKYTDNGQQGGGGGSLSGAQFVINTTTTAYNVTQYKALASGWHLIAGTYDGSSLRLYVDGTLAAERTVTGTLVTNSTNVTIGGFSGGKGYFSGLIDEVQLFNRALSSTEVEELFFAGTVGVCK